MSNAATCRRLWIVLALTVYVAASIHGQTILREVQENGELRGGIVDGDLYPFVYLRGGVWDGYEITLMREIAAELGVTLSIIPFESRDALREAVADGDIHVAFSKVFRDLDNSERAFQTSPVASLDLMIVANRTAYSAGRTGGTLSGDLLRGAVPVAVADEAAFVREVSRTYPRADLSIVESRERLWRGVESGDFVAIALDEASVYRYFVEHPERGIQLRVLPLPTSTAVVGLVPWRDDFLWEWVNILVEGQGDPATVGELVERYEFGTR